MWSCCTILVLVASSWPHLVAITSHAISIFFQEDRICLWALLLLLPNLGTFCPLLQIDILCFVVLKTCLWELVVKSTVVVVTIMRLNNRLYLLWVYLLFLIAVGIWRSSMRMRRKFCLPLYQQHNIFLFLLLFLFVFWLVVRYMLSCLEKFCAREEWGKQGPDGVVDACDKWLFKCLTTCFMTTTTICLLYQTAVKIYLLGLC